MLHNLWQKLFGVLNTFSAFLKLEITLVFIPFVAPVHNSEETINQYSSSHSPLGLKADKCLYREKYLEPSDLDDGTVETSHSIFREPRILKRFGYLSVGFYLQKESLPKFLLWGNICVFILFFTVIAEFDSKF